MEPAERTSPPTVACVGAVVHDAAGRLLLVQRGQEPSRGSWSLPGGRVEAGETPEVAVEREVLEETGLRVQVGRLVGRVRVPGPGVVYDVLDFACTLTEPGQQPVAGDDAVAALFADASTLSALHCTPRLVETLGDWGVLPT